MDGGRVCRTVVVGSHSSQVTLDWLHVSVVFLTRLHTPWVQDLHPELLCLCRLRLSHVLTGRGVRVLLLSQGTHLNSPRCSQDPELPGARKMPCPLGALPLCRDCKLRDAPPPVPQILA